MYISLGVICETQLCSLHVGNCFIFVVCINRIGLKGFLFKRGSSKFKMWNRRYFIMKDNQLQYQKKGPAKVCLCLCVLSICVCSMLVPLQSLTTAPLQETHLVAEDLRLCAVKNVEDIERRFCFEIVAPTK